MSAKSSVYKQPRQKSRQKNPARLKTRKGGLGKSQGKRPWAWRKFPKGHHGQKLHGIEERKRKIKTTSKDNKMDGSLIAQIKR